MKCVSLLTSLLIATFFSIQLSAKSPDLRSTSDALLFVESIQAGVNMPSQASMAFFNLDASDREAFASILQNGFIDLQNDSEKRLYMKAVLPAKNIIHNAQTTSRVEAERSGVDRATRMQHVSYAFEILGAVGSQELGSAGSYSNGVSSGQSVGGNFFDATGMMQRFGTCIVLVALDDGMANELNQGGAITGSVNMGGFSGEFHEGQLVDLALGTTCGDLDNDKKCDPSDDVLTSDKCINNTDTYCALTPVTGGGGVKRCSDISDGVDDQGA